MKHRYENLIAWPLLAAALGWASPTIAQADPNTNPPPGNSFSVGVVPVQLTQPQIDDLDQYVNQSKTTLEQALADGKDRGVDEESRVYLDAIKSVIPSSDKDNPRSELLMRIILNQALALTYGTPNAAGTGIEIEGVLVNSAYTDLLPAILRDSIRMALEYVDKDLEAVKKKSLIDLPYSEVAIKQLKYAEFWMRSVVLNPGESANFGLTSLQLWLNTVLAADHLHPKRDAESIKLVRAAQAQAKQIAASKKPLEVVQGQQSRLARITMRRVIAKMEAELGASAASIPVVNSAPGAVMSEGEFVRFTGVTFSMGSNEGDPGHRDDEGKRAHAQTIGAFWMQKHDVIQDEWTARYPGFNPSNFKGGKRPVESVTWFSVAAYANDESKARGWEQCYTFSGCSGRVEDGSLGNADNACQAVLKPNCTGLRLPTEAEWEWAARGGNQAGTPYIDAYWWGNDESKAAEHAWVAPGANGQTHDVCGEGKVNPFGLCDMNGNVWQWVQDWYGNYPDSDAPNYQGPASGSDRVFRGGSWYNAAVGARSAYRSGGGPSYRGPDVGFRLVRTP